MTSATETPTEAEALDAYSRTVSGVAERLAPSVANLKVMRRTRGGRVPAGAGSGVVLTADAEEAAIEQPHRAREHALAGDALASEVRVDLPPHAGQGAREVDHLVELLLVAPLAPAAVVDVLLAATRVDSRRLDVAHGVRADPDVLPRRWDDKLADPAQHLGFGDLLPVVVHV